ncbi:MAG: hypothetical protein JRM77_10115 [Nitrososphaerota archaeon]|nr:hypothetical protein [Nitrososphaerota archaeon]
MRRLSALLIGALLAFSFMGLAILPPAVHASGGAPTIYASAANSCVDVNTCSITFSNTVYGDLIIVVVQTPVSVSLSDTFGSVFNTAASKAAEAIVYYVTLTSSGSDTFTITGAGTTNTVALEAFEVQGLFTNFVVTSGTGGGSGTALATSSTSYTGYTTFCVASLFAAGELTTPGTDFTFLQGSALDFAAEYSTTVASPTTFPATSGVSGTWYDAGACFTESYVNPSNVQIVQANTPSPVPFFYINEYKDSFLQINYPTVTPTYVKPVSVPQLEESLSGSNLLTLWVGSSYFATLITGTNNTFYLSPPSQVNEYTFNVEDLSGQFSAGATVEIELGNVVIRSGYLDGSNSFVAWLPAGYYTVVLSQNGASYSVPENLPLASGVNQIAIQILYQAFTSTCGGLCEVSDGANITGTNAIITYKDLSGTTTSINDSIYRQNATGTYRVYTHLWTSVSSLTDTVSCDNDNCNATIGSQLYVVLIWDNTFGSNQQARIPLSGYGVPIPFSGLNDVFGWGYSFPNIPISEFLAFGIIVLAAAGMGALAAKFGAIVLAVLVAALSAFGWLPGLGAAMITLLVAFAVLAFVAWLEQGR